jgi:hypothetical protein
MRNALARLACGLLLAATLPATAGDVTIYRCTDARGHLTLRDTPCTKGERQETREMLRPKDGAPAVAATPAPVQPRNADNAAPPRMLVLRAPQPLYECVTPDGDHYTSDTPEGRPRWVPLWTLGYPVPMAPYPYPSRRTGTDLAITGGNVSIHAGSTVLVPPPAYPAYPATAGTWIRDACHALPQQEVCARLHDRRDEIRRRFFNAQPSERDVLRVEERGINARLDNDCGGH